MKDEGDRLFPEVFSDSSFSSVADQFFLNLGKVLEEEGTKP